MNESFCNCGNPKKNHYPMEHMKGMWDSSEGQTHFQNDGCGEKEHNDPAKLIEDAGKE